MKNLSYLHKINLVFVAAFLVFIFVPNLDTAFKLDPVPQRSENRARASFPKFPAHIEDFKKLPKAFEDYYTDNFGFRNLLIKMNALIKYFALKTSPSEQVVIGKNGWLYLARQENVESYRHIDPFTEEELEAFTLKLRQRQAWAEKQGMQYIYIVGPDSHTLTPENLPEWATKVNPGSRLDQLIDHAKRTANIDILDVRPAIWEAKKIGQVSYRTDSHWSGFGAYIAYREIVKRIQSRYPQVQGPVPLSDFEFREFSDSGLDLAKLMGLNDLIPETIKDIVYLKPDPFEVTEKEGLHFSTVNPQGMDFPIVMVCDSMAGNLFPHLGRQFSKVRYLWGYPFETEKILKYKPKVIIHLVIERSLLWEQVPNPPEVQAAFNEDLKASNN